VQIPPSLILSTPDVNPETASKFKFFDTSPFLRITAGFSDLGQHAIGLLDTANVKNKLAEP
jgi:hypothetical protein